MEVLRMELDQEASFEENFERTRAFLEKVQVVFESNGMGSLTILERPGEGFQVMSRQISKAAIATFITELFLKDPELHEEINKTLKQIMTNMQKPTATVH